MPLDAPRELLSLANRLRLIDQRLEAAPGRIRLYPIRRAVWRWLLMPTGDLSLLAALLPAPEMEAMAGLEAPLGSLDVIVLRLVGKALRGDCRAAGWIFDVIEGRPERRLATTRSSRYLQGKRSTAVDLDPAERARMITDLEAALRNLSSG